RLRGSGRAGKPDLRNGPPVAAFAKNAGGTGSAFSEPAFLANAATGAARVEVIRNESNVGFPRGCNQGLEKARGRCVVVVNNETVLTPGWLDGLVALSLCDWP